MSLERVLNKWINFFMKEFEDIMKQSYCFVGNQSYTHNIYF